MKGLPSNSSALLLRRSEPELALRLETAQLVAEAENLGLVHSVRRTLKSVSMEIAMSENLMMRVSPIRKGAKGFAEWGIYLKNPFKPAQVEFLIHAHIEIFIDSESKPKDSESFTTIGKSLKGILNQGIEIFHVLTGSRISLVTRGESN